MEGEIERVPCPKPWGQPRGLDAVARKNIFDKTGVSVSLQQKKHWGETWHLLASGPISNLEEAAQMAV